VTDRIDWLMNEEGNGDAVAATAGPNRHKSSAVFKMVVLAMNWRARQTAARCYLKGEPSYLLGGDSEA